MWKLIAPRESLLQHGFVYDTQDRRYIQDDILGYGGEVYINDNEDFFRSKMFCWEWGDDAIYVPEHITDKDDWRMEDLEKAGIVVFTE